MEMMTRDNIVEILSTNKAVVTFVKKDGTLRDMRCTRDFNAIPASAHPKNESDRQVNESVVTAYDLEKSAWRSFRVDSVKVIEVYS